MRPSRNRDESGLWQEVLAGLRRRLGDPDYELPPLLWRKVVRPTVLAEALSGQRHPADIAVEIYGLLDATGMTRHIKRKAKRRTLVLDETAVAKIANREAARSLLYARRAKEEPGVLAFRGEVLRGRLVPRERIAEWIETQADKDGPASRWLEVRLPDDVALRVTDSGQALPDPDMSIGTLGGGTIHQDRLEFALPDGWGTSVSTALGGVLERLRVLSAYLAEKYCWDHSAATHFVLAGGVPIVEGIRFTIKATGDPAERVVIDLDPDVSPRELAAAYRRQRLEISGGRRRTVTIKTMRLAAFDATDTGGIWKARMDRWNKANPNSRYENWRNFQRDVAAATRRLSRPVMDSNKLFESLWERLGQHTIAAEPPQENDSSKSRGSKKRKRE